MDEVEVRREFGALLTDLPPAPQHLICIFRTDTAELTEESRAVLRDVLNAAKTRAVPEVTVIGHTDTTGSAARRRQGRRARPPPNKPGELTPEEYQEMKKHPVYRWT